MVVLLTSILVGGLTVALAPGFTKRTTDSVREEPIPALLFGIAVLVTEFVAIFVTALFSPLVLLVAIPLVVLGAAT